MNPERFVRGVIDAALGGVQLDLVGAELILAATGCLALVVEWLAGRRRQHLVGYASLVGMIAACFYVSVVLLPRAHQGPAEAFSGLVVLDSFAVFFKLLFLLASALIVLLSMRYLDEEKAHHGEYYALICFATVGMMFMASTQDLLVIFVALELMALSIYVLVGFLRDSPRSNEAAMKYFILGAMSSAFFLYGISLFYGVAGSTSLEPIRLAVAAQPENPLVTLGLILMSVGLGFKVAAVPFHAWAPDAYEGAPTPITAYVSVASKSAAFAVLLRILLVGLYDLRGDWMVLLTVLAIASMVLGNVVAVVQDNAKRMLAYSSIAHAGYLLVGVLAAGAGVPEEVAARQSVLQQVRWTGDLQRWAQGGVLLYLLAYAFMTIGAFAVIAYLRREKVIGDRVEDFAGLYHRSPKAAIAMSVFLLSLAGIPPTGGFVGKLVLFGAAIKAKLFLVAVIAVLTTAVSVYFYFRIVVMMWMKEPAEERPYALSGEWAYAVTVCLLLTLLMGLWPPLFVNLAQSSVLDVPSGVSALSRMW